jgi:hypothetical protein
VNADGCAHATLWRRSRHLRRLVVLGSGLLCLAILRADSVTLVPVADTTLFESAPDDNMGGWTHLASGTTGSQAERTRNRALLRFDLAAALPLGARITNAVLTLTVVGIPGTAGGGGPVNSVFALHRLHRSWGEGDKLGDRGFPADPGEATWNFRSAPDQRWGTPGGAAPEDFATSASATKLVAGKGTYAFGSTPGLVADAQDWLDLPTSNSGWLLLSQAEPTGKTARRFGSREDSVNAPRLRLDFTSPSPLRIEQVEVATNRFQLRFTARAGLTYAVEFRHRLSEGAWLNLTNVAASPTDTATVVADDLAAPERYYRLRAP